MSEVAPDSPLILDDEDQTRRARTKSVESSSSLLDMALRPGSNLLALLGGYRYRGDRSFGSVYLERRARSNSVSSIPSVSTTLSDDSFDRVSMVSSASSADLTVAVSPLSHELVFP